MVVEGSGLIRIRIGSYQNVWIRSDDQVYGRSAIVDWFTFWDFDRFFEELYILKNLLYYIENGHNEVTT